MVCGCECGRRLVFGRSGMTLSEGRGVWVCGEVGGIWVETGEWRGVGVVKACRCIVVWGGGTRERRCCVVQGPEGRERERRTGTGGKWRCWRDETHLEKGRGLA